MIPWSVWEFSILSITWEIALRQKKGTESSSLMMAKSSIWSIKALYMSYSLKCMSERIRPWKSFVTHCVFQLQLLRTSGGAGNLITAIWLNHNKIKSYKNYPVTKPTSSEVWGKYISEVNGSRWSLRAFCLDFPLRTQHNSVFQVNLSASSHSTLACLQLKEIFVQQNNSQYIFP